MSAHDPVEVIRHDNAIVEIRLARPEVRNALNETTALALTDALQAAADDPSVHCVVLSGDGASFCAGADITEFEANPSTLASERLATLFTPALRCMTEMPKPVIAAINGAAAGIGVAYVLSSDLVLMAHSAYLKLAFIDIGLIPDGGITWHLVRRVGHVRAFELAATAAPIDAATCRTLGLANHVVDDESLRDEALRWACMLTAQPHQAIAHTKQALRAAAFSNLDTTFEREGRLQDACKASPAFAERIAAFRAARRR
ncbi:enoyl-CoA hydratase/isomerase family protein [Halomonas borealis]|jgi:2-(1,2-epoxy-1,2-dihydrophenyl)acetyl-CoA isomerase|uniref:enoyl-CoA hydratase/isomerase family protein n=1 Tax=Halomonas borealis TaxID=2508710 RepID=UPI00109F1FED|nr:enoyl-CoA hydratase-related protein [Halomonas borealis]